MSESARASEPKPGSRETRIVVLVIVGILVLVVGLACVLTIPRLLTKQSGHSTIGTATGEYRTVVESKGGNRYHLIYAYEVDGVRYEIVGEGTHRNRDVVEYRAANGATVLVTYDPNDPRVAMADDAMPDCRGTTLHCENLSY